MATGSLHWCEHLCWDARVPVTWLLTLLGSMDPVLTWHRSPVPDTVTGSGVAVVAYNQRCLRCSQEDFSGRTKRSRAARAVERHSHGPLPEDMAISESISVILHQLCWRSWEG